MKISFIVLTYNRSDAALAVLRSLARQCLPDDEILVADDGSRPEHVRRLLENAPSFACKARHLWHPDVGFTAAAARNLAAARAEGDYLVFLDGDCVPGPRFAHHHRALAEQGCFVNGSRVLLSEKLTQAVLAEDMDLSQARPGFWWRAWRRGDANKLLHLVHWPDAWRTRYANFRWKGIRSCNFGVWRKDYEAVNGFDQVFEGWGHEDADLVLRLHHHGLKRKNGFLATEVYHLWHKEHPRHNEDINRLRVLERQRQRTVKAQKGLDELLASPGVITTPFGRK